MNLYETTVPYALGTAEADIPTITVYTPEGAKGPVPALLICPGGGYHGLCSSYEGHDIARWLNGFGFAGVVLKYRLSPYRHPIPLLDAQRAMRLTRLHAAEWNIRTDCLGVIGFSAGGHLAATLSTHYDLGNAAAAEAVERQSCRPDFQVLIYPVVTFVGTHVQTGTQVNLIGAEAPEGLRRYLSAERQVTVDTPEAFVSHSVKDQIVDVENARMYVSALQTHGVPVEYAELPSGLHGLGCGKGADWEAWQAACKKWLLARLASDWAAKP